MTVAKNARAYLKELPKADLHCHLLGTVRASTFAELARRENLTLPEAPERIYTSVNSKPPDPDLYRNTRIPMAQVPAADEPQDSYSLFIGRRPDRKITRLNSSRVATAYAVFCL